MQDLFEKRQKNKHNIEGAGPYPILTKYNTVQQNKIALGNM